MSKPANKKTANYEVGYKKPPRDTRFQPGKSGNPKGKKMQKMTFDEILSAQLQRQFPMKRDGKIEYFTPTEAIIQRILQMAVQGNLSSIKYILPSIQKILKKEIENPLGEIGLNWEEEFERVIGALEVYDEGERPSQETDQPAPRKSATK